MAMVRRRLKGLDDQIANAINILAGTPDVYQPGALARIAQAYDDAGEPDKAASTRRLAVQESALGSFAQASVDKQRRMIGELPSGDLRDNAQTIQAHQAHAFDRDAFGAGTALYKEVGPAVPLDDIVSRVRRAREIAQLRGFSVAPFTAAEIDGLRHALATGSRQDRQAVRALLAAVPDEMRPAIEPAIPDTTTPSEDTSQSPPPGAEQQPEDGPDASGLQSAAEAPRARKRFSERSNSPIDTEFPAKPPSAPPPEPRSCARGRSATMSRS
jgi:hypothetical protein